MNEWSRIEAKSILGAPTEELLKAWACLLHAKSSIEFLNCKLQLSTSEKERREIAENEMKEIIEIAKQEFNEEHPEVRTLLDELKRRLEQSYFDIINDGIMSEADMNNLLIQQWEIFSWFEQEINKLLMKELKQVKPYEISA